LKLTLTLTLVMVMILAPCLFENFLHFLIFLVTLAKCPLSHLFLRCSVYSRAAPTRGAGAGECLKVEIGLNSSWRIAPVGHSGEEFKPLPPTFYPFSWISPWLSESLSIFFPIFDFNYYICWAFLFHL
jgi:hypothetical protein